MHLFRRTSLPACGPPLLLESLNSVADVLCSRLCVPTAWARCNRGGKSPVRNGTTHRPFPIIRACLPLDLVLPNHASYYVLIRASGVVDLAPLGGRPYPNRRFIHSALIIPKYAIKDGTR